MMRLLAVILLIFASVCSPGKKAIFTQVTFMYDIKRSDLKSRLNRPFSFYLSYFEQLLASDFNIIVFGSHQLKEFVWQRRKQHNTVFIEKQLSTFKDYWYFPFVQNLREKRLNDPNFQFKGHPQFGLQYYNPIVLSKPFLMQEAIRYDKWNTDYLIWTDGGYMHIFSKNAASPENVIKKFYQLIQPQWIHLGYYLPSQLLIGYEKGELRYIDRKVKFHEAILAGNTGGSIHIIRDIKCAYENLLRITLENEDLNAEETIVSMMTIRFPFLIPNIVNVNFEYFFNKFHNYEDINRISIKPRFWKGVIDSQGEIQVIQNKIILRQQSNFNKIQSKNFTVALAPLEQMQTYNSIINRQNIQLKKIHEIFSIKLTIESTIAYKKIAHFAVIFVLYLLMVLKNKRLKKIINRNVQNQPS